ncbi:MAG: general stress protein CsbD [Cytophagaceae bacterium]|nr:general stress protein CsbD [Cytophagaceae bacterium]
MNQMELEGKWKQVKGKFKQKYGDLTDDDTTFAEGKFDEMLGRLQEKTGKTKSDLKKEIETW